MSIVNFFFIKYKTNFIDNYRINLFFPIISLKYGSIIFYSEFRVGFGIRSSDSERFSGRLQIEFSGLGPI